ncbi:hypothetical protein HD599_003246 [Conyzicola lurida]|uniref:Tyr recombinase domain-containing protein n=1 Tax=Conyzicola lurida TaxID=1172621 RepID=A0A841ATF1_9MICO|nr:hypothetical protein [Conyzicola lurida]MBB5844923.1 hypothetical protein [Conyzicola lurida]
MNYTPTIDDAAWASIKGLVADSVSRCSGNTAYSDTDLYQAATRFVAWTQSSTALSLADDLFAPSVIEDFVAQGLPDYAPASRGNRRSILLRMSETILGERASRVRLKALPSSEPSRPYSDEEISSLRKWARELSSLRRTRAMALLGLGIGAGLSSGEITALRCGDVASTGAGVVVSVCGARARDVTVQRGWERAVSEAVSGGDDDRWVFCPERTTGGKNMVTNFLAKNLSADVRPNVQRMRATWIVGQLDRGTPALQLVKESGVRSMAALSRFVPFADAA